MEHPTEGISIDYEIIAAAATVPQNLLAGTTLTACFHIGYSRHLDAYFSP
jgi:hypothetical protein